jgi:F420-dependent oxidoreductase-like protein
MRVGVHVVRYDVPGGVPALPDVLAELARTCDDVGVDVLSLLDHWFGLPYLGPVDAPMLEGYSTLGFVAAHSSRVELQLLVSGVTYRPPGLLAKIVATLDVLSEGRAALGIGAGWHEREHRGLGVPFPPLRDRFELLDETIPVVRQMWSDDDGPWSGRHYRLAETVCVPRPRHRIPVVVGGTDERKALRLVARHADACSLFAGGELGAAFVASKLAVLRQHCEREGTSYDAIRRTVLWTSPVDATAPGPFLEAMRAMADVGVEEVHLVPGRDAVADLRAMSRQLLPALDGV